MGEIKTGIRFYPRHDIEDARAHFANKVYEKYSKYLVDSVHVEKIIEQGEKHYYEMGF